MLGLAPAVTAALTRPGFAEPTPIQTRRCRARWTVMTSWGWPRPAPASPWPSACRRSNNVSPSPAAPKRGKCPHADTGAHDAERVQVFAQALIMESGLR